ncbi:hypothetical protein [Streptomyces sp. NPDC048057]|uniref:hypothetical protein n=1 Tax=Streptomyces sp. NPDC048057 TaxID=3155628 RepID=UPI0033F96A45
MDRRRSRMVAGIGAAVVVALVAGGLGWAYGDGDDSGDEITGPCRDVLAVEEARAFFGGVEVEARGNTGQWGGHDTDWCSVRPRGDDQGSALKLQIRPVEAHRASGAAEEAGANPIGYGWQGSVATHYGEPKGAVLLDCEQLPGKGLLVLAEATRRVDELTDAQVLQVARLTTETARRAADRLGCEGTPGERPDAVDRRSSTNRPAAEAVGTCKGVVGPGSARALAAATVVERPAGRALTERCEVELAKEQRVRLSAYYGPSALQETYLDRRYPGSVPNIVTRLFDCPGALGTAYVKLSPPKQANGEPAQVDRRTDAVYAQLLSSFAAASAARHGCPAP